MIISIHFKEYNVRGLHHLRSIVKSVYHLMFKKGFPSFSSCACVKVYYSRLLSVYLYQKYCSTHLNDFWYRLPINIDCMCWSIIVVGGGGSCGLPPRGGKLGSTGAQEQERSWILDADAGLSGENGWVKAEVGIMGVRSGGADLATRTKQTSRTASWRQMIPQLWRAISGSPADQPNERTKNGCSTLQTCSNTFWKRPN